MLFLLTPQGGQRLTRSPLNAICDLLTREALIGEPGVRRRSPSCLGPGALFRPAPVHRGAAISLGIVID
jgi:hypothetical protein